jgi:hypothetical protein
VIIHAAPFIRKSSVWVAHNWMGPGRSSLTTEAAARRSHLSTRHITGGCTADLPPGDSLMISTPAGPSWCSDSYDPSTGIFFVFFLSTLVFERLRRLLGHRLAGRLICHVCPLSCTPPYCGQRRPWDPHPNSIGKGPPRTRVLYRRRVSVEMGVTRRVARPSPQWSGSVDGDAGLVDGDTGLNGVACR